MKHALKLLTAACLLLSPFAIAGCRLIEKTINAFRLVPLVLVGGCLTGCTITTSNQGEAGFRWGTEFTFFSRSAKTADEPATIKSEVPALEEWFRKSNELPGPPPPVVEVEKP